MITTTKQKPQSDQNHELAKKKKDQPKSPLKEQSKRSNKHGADGVAVGEEGEDEDPPAEHHLGQQKHRRREHLHQYHAEGGLDAIRTPHPARHCSSKETPRCNQQQEI